MTEAHDDEPDPRLLWRWLGRASRPWAGWAFIGVGALAMLLGYLGVSRESIVAKQIPYIVSGGIGGVLLVVVGAYFLGTEEMRKDSGRLDRLEQMVEELHAALLDRPDAPARHEGASVTNGERATTVLAVPDGETFHRAGCMLVVGKSDAESMTPAAAKRRKLQPCPLCEPTGVGV